VTGVVLDASVAAKWALPARHEQLRPQAFDLLDRYLNKEIEFLVPDVFWTEIAHVLWKAVRQRRQSRADAHDALAEIIARNFFTVASIELLPEALSISLSFDQAVYDCLYIALARRTSMQLITADERLANAMAARFPVKWLGAF
jgi:predicted nucleic acid-binding protein